MKRIILILLIAGLSTGLKGQDFVDLGVHLGYYSSKFVTDLDHYNPTERKSLALGGFLRLGANTKYYFQAECYLANKGGAFYFNGLPGDPLTPNLQLENAELRMRLTTVNMPLMVGYHLLQFPTSNLRVMAGPVVSWTIGEKVTLNSSGVDHSSDLPALMFRDKVWNFQYGIGMDIWKLSFNFRHEVTLQNMSTIGGFRQRGSLYFASVGYKFL